MAITLYMLAEIKGSSFVARGDASESSVSVEQREKKQDFRRFAHAKKGAFCPREKWGVLPTRKMGRFARAKNGARAKMRRRGWVRGRKETLAAKHCDFQILRSPANGARDWLG